MRLTLLLLLFVQQPKEAHLRAIWGATRTLDPALADGRFVAPLFEGLTTYAADNVTIAPGMAESWSTDGATWTFTLRDAKWSNGRAVTAEDFRFAWLRCLDPELGCPRASTFAVIKNAETLRLCKALDAALIEWDVLGPVRRAEVIALAKQGATKRHAKKLLSLTSKGEEQKALTEVAGAVTAREDVTEASVGIVADKKTMKVELVRPMPSFAQVVAGPLWAPVPAETIQEHREKWTQAGKIVTNGPYAVERFTQADLVLVKSKTYWGKCAGPDRVTLLLTGWPAEVMARWDRLEADWIAGELTYPEKLDEYAKKGDWRGWPLFATWFVRVNATKPPFDNAGMRRWIAFALDREKAGPPRSTTAKALVPPGVPGYSASLARAKDSASAWVEFIKEVPDASKLPKLNVLVPKPYVEMAAAIKTQIEADFPDVRVRVDAPDWPAYAASLEAGEYHLAIGACTPDVLDPAPFLELFTKSSPLNTTGWSSADFDTLIAAVGLEKDIARRLELLAKAEGLLLDGGAVIPLAHPSGGALVRAKVKFEGNGFGRVLLQHVRAE